jgi:hypothetical protein
MCTINALCLDSLPEFIDELHRFKKIYGKESISFTLNILRFPSFQSPLVLSVELRTKYLDKPAISFTDFTSMSIMKELKITHVLSQDEHFIQVGMGLHY